MNGIYEHFKGNRYQVYGKCIWNDNLFVVYKPLYNDTGLWIREFDMFFEEIIRDDKTINRFKLVSANNEELEVGYYFAKHSETLENCKIRKIENNEFIIEL